MFKWAQRIARILIVIMTSSFLIFSAIVAWYGFGFRNADRLKTPELAFWMSHAWSTSERGDYLTLANQLDELPPTSLYFHVGPLTPEGGLAEDLEIVPSLLDTLPSTNYAWVGQIRSEIDLDDPAVRASIVSSSEWLLGQGFDGLHINIEPVRHDDTAFVQLIQELDTAFPTTPISISMDEWQPHLITKLIAEWFDAVSISYWPSDLILELRPHVDEFVVMTYDTGFHDPEFYSWWVEQQTIAMSKLMDDETRLLIGLPVYDEGSNIDPLTENLETGIIGFTRGLSNLRSNPDAIDGIAIYPYWEMDELEWDILNAYLNETPLP